MEQNEIHERIESLQNRMSGLEHLVKELRTNVKEIASFLNLNIEAHYKEQWEVDHEELYDK